MHANSKKTISALLVTVLILSIGLFLIHFTQAQGSNWSVTVNSRPLKAYPNLVETIWVKNASMAPNGPYDQIGLHRLIQNGTTPKGVVFIAGCPSWGMGTFMISNPVNDSWTKVENYSQAIFWANRGFDVYAIDFRTFFAPNPLNTSISSFAFEGNWTWDVWVNDLKEAVDQAKLISGVNKLFIMGQCTGAEAVLNYATKYQTNINGLILEDLNFLSVPGYPIISEPKSTNNYNLTQAINNMTATNAWFNPSTLNVAVISTLSSYALNNPSGPAQYANGTAFQPPINPATNTSWSNVTEYYTYFLQNSFLAPGNPPGLQSNATGGMGNVTQFEYCNTFSEPFPNRLTLENIAMANWTNCPYMPYDYNDHYKEVAVPMLVFSAANFANASGTFRFINGTATNDFTGVYLPNYGHTDVFFGTYSARDVSQPALNWMINHTTTIATSPTPTQTITSPTPTQTVTSSTPSQIPTPATSPSPTPKASTSVTTTPSTTISPSPTIPEYPAAIAIIIALLLLANVALSVIIRKRKNSQ